VPVTSEGPLVSRCLGVSLSATTGFSVTAGNCAVKRSLVCQRVAMIQASGGGEPSGGHSLRPGIREARAALGRSLQCSANGS
jgi:hypothetical protein